MDSSLNAVKVLELAQFRIVKTKKLLARSLDPLPRSNLRESGHDKLIPPFGFIAKVMSAASREYGYNESIYELFDSNAFLILL